MKILHVITGLNNGGAEAVLFRLIGHSIHRETHHVISLLDDGFYGAKLRDLGVHVDTLNLSGLNGLVRGLPRMFRIIRRVRPDVVQTHMYHANFFGGMAARLGGCRGVVWGIHHSSLSGDKMGTRLIARMCGPLSRWVPSAIVCCSENGADIHVSMGYRRDSVRIIPNGYDLSVFCSDDAVRDRVRANWCRGNNDLLFGMVGRWNAQKDHANLLQALSLLKRGNLDFRCLLVGPGMKSTNRELMKVIKANGLEDRVIPLGPRDDVPALMNALDIHILSSAYGEAFPNVVAEAMACGTPSVTTDVGDAAFIVGNDEWVAPPRNPKLLADAVVRALGDIEKFGRPLVGRRCRSRIKEHFALERMVESYRGLWSEVSTGRGEAS